MSNPSRIAASVATMLEVVHEDFVRTLHGHVGKAPNSVAVSADGRLLASVGGDGLQATAGATLNITGTYIAACERAGILFDGAAGTVSDSESTRNAHGLVLQGDATATDGDGNLWSRNITGNIWPI